MPDINFSLYANDPVLVGIGELNEALILDLLDEHIDHKSLDAPIGRYVIDNVRYSPRQKLVLGLTAPDSVRPIAMRIYPPGNLDKRVALARQEGACHVFAIPPINAIVWVFPSEKKLELKFLLEPDGLAALLKSQRHLQLDVWQLVRYVPEHGYTALVQGTTADSELVDEYLKVQYSNCGESTCQLMNHLAQALGDDGSVVVPTPVSYSVEHNALLQPALSRDIKRSATDDEVATALAALHGVALPNSMPIPNAIDRFENQLNEVLHLVNNTFSNWTGPIKRLCAEIRQLPNIMTPPVVTLHGDVHLGNFFPLTDGRLGVIDFDSSRRGDPAEDLCSYFAFLQWIDMKEGKTSRTLLASFDQLIERYNKRSETPVPRTHAYKVLAQQLIFERIRRGLKRGKITGAADLAAFFTLAEQCVSHARESRRD